MPETTRTTFAAAIVLSLLAGPAFAAPEQDAATANAANECHAAPKGTAPQGAHWYYRTDRATKKKCWYLADEVAKAKKAAPSKPSASAEDKSSPTAETSQPEKAERVVDKSVANARAEIPADKKPTEPKPSAEEQKLSETVWPPIPEQPEATAEAQPPAASESGGAFASRWPDQVSTAAATDAQALLARKQTENQQVAAAAPQPAPSTVGRAEAAPAEPQSSGTSVGTIGLLLSVLVGLLALAAIIGPAIFKYVRPRQNNEPRPRRAIWDTAEETPELPLASETTRNDNLPRDLRDLDAPQDELEKLLQRASKRSAA